MKNRICSWKSLLLTPLLACATSAFAAPQKQEAAAPQQPETPPHVTLMHPNYMFEVSFTGLALQPFANNTDYAAEAIPFNYGDNLPVLSPSWVIPQISPDFQFAFDVGIAGIFHGANSTLMLNWERMHSSDESASRTVSSSAYMIGPFFEIGPDASVYKTSTGKVNFNFDEVNLDYGTFVQFGKLLRTNFFAGVSFSHIVEHRSTSFASLDGTDKRTLYVPSSFMGAGPQIGMDFNYKIVEGFQFVGTGRASLFVGRFKNSTTFKTYSPDLVSLGNPSPNIQTTTVYNKSGIVPGFEGKLGLAYEVCFGKHYMFKIEAGYQAQIYLNSIRSIDLDSEVDLGTTAAEASQTTGVYARTFGRTVSDFGMAGPYATVDFGF